MRVKGERKKLIGPRLARQTFAAGLLPAIDYGAEVVGFDDAQLRTTITHYRYLHYEH